MRHAASLDPDVAAGLEALPPDLDATRGVDAFTLTERQRAWPAGSDEAAGLVITDRLVPGLDGNPGVPVRAFSREDGGGDNSRRVLVLHGGGFISGSPALAGPVLQQIAGDLDAVVVAPTYRLAPAHPYPAAFEDVLAVSAWMAEDGVPGDPDRLVVFGVSSGACLAAALAMHAKETGRPQITACVLGYPVLSDALDTPSMDEVDDPRVWNRGMTELAWRAYLGERFGADSLPITAVPARATDLTGFPPTTITVNDHDPLRDEGIAFAQRLMQAGVPTELHVFPGTFHGSMGTVPDAPVSRREQQAMLDAIARA